MPTPKNRTKRVMETVADQSDIESRFEHARSEFYRIAANLAESGSAKAREFTEMAASKAGDVKNDVSGMTGDALDSFLDQIAGLEKDVATKVREKPLQSLAIAGGIGFLLALLSRR